MRDLKTIVFSSVLFILSFCFWFWIYPGHVSYQEQSVMFLWTTDYLLQYLGYPSGIAEYVGNFLAQFCFETWIGATIYSLLLEGVYILTCRIIERWVGKLSILWRFVAVLPGLVLFLAMLDKDTLLSLPLSVVLMIVAILLCQHVSRYRFVALLATLLLLYYIIGAISVLFALYVAIEDIFKRRSYVAILLLPIFLLLPFLAYQFIPLSLSRLYTSDSYYRVGGASPSFKFDFKEEQALRISRLMRFKEWDRVVAIAEQSMPDDMSARQAVLMSLAQQGELTERLFDFSVLDKTDLLCEPNNEMVDLMLVSDVFFNLGMINQAEQVAYNVQQLKGSWSTRAMVRLVECCLVKGDLSVAEKYLDILSHTFYYKGWTEYMRKMVSEPSKLFSNQYYGTIRHRLAKVPFYYNDSELDNILAHVVSNNNDLLVYDYLVAYLLLSRDLKSLTLICENHREKMPRAVQEALVFSWMQDNPTFTDIEWNIEDEVKNRAVLFARKWVKGEGLEGLKKSFGNTFWYYNALAIPQQK